MKEAKIGLVTVLYNSGTVLNDFYRTLSSQTYNNFVLYVVDNNSPDNSLEVVKKLSKTVSFETIIIEEKENFGVAKGNNIGINAALEGGCDYILLTNNDVELEQDTIEILYKGMLSVNADMAVPKIYYYGTKVIWAAGGCFTFLTRSTRHIGGKEEDKGQYNIAKQVDYAPTCFMLIDKRVFSEIGFMDEKYFVYFDDTDFIYRATQGNGKKLFYLPDAILYHKESVSTGKDSPFSTYYYCRNILYFNGKNRSSGSLFIALAILILSSIKSQFLHFDSVNFDAFLRGVKDGIKLYLNASK